MQINISRTDIPQSHTDKTGTYHVHAPSAAPHPNINVSRRIHDRRVHTLAHRKEIRRACYRPKNANAKTTIESTAAAD